MDSQTTETVQIVVNGDGRDVRAGLSLLDLLALLEIAPDRVAIELDRRIVGRAEWDSTKIRSGAALEIVHFVGGG